MALYQKQIMQEKDRYLRKVNYIILIILILFSFDLYGENKKLKLLDYNENLKVGIITPDLDIVENPNKLSPAYIVFENYEKVLKWNRSLRFALAVCTLKDKIKNEI